MNASAAAIDQTSVCSRLTGMPSRLARSRALGTGSESDPGPGPVEEETEQDNGHGYRDQRQEVAGTEHDRRDLEMEVEGFSEPGGEELDMEPAREQHGQPSQQLRQPERGHHQNQTGCLEESTDDDELDQRPQDNRTNQADQTSQHIRKPSTGHQQDDADHRQRAQIALGEVEHTIGAVDERHPEGHQGREASDDGTLHPLTGRNGIDDELAGDDDDRGQERSAPDQEGLTGSGPAPGARKYGARAVWHGTPPGRVVLPLRLSAGDAATVSDAFPGDAAASFAGRRGARRRPGRWTPPAAGSPGGSVSFRASSVGAARRAG